MRLFLYSRRDKMDFGDLINTLSLFVKITQPLVFLVVLRFIASVFSKPEICPESDISWEEGEPEST